MIQSITRISSLLILALSLGAFGCTSTSKAAKTNTVAKKMDVPQDTSAQQPAKNLYLMLRLSQEDSTGVINIIRIEKQIYDRQGNPLPLDANITGKQLFSCVMKQQNGETVQKSEQKINFTLGESGNEAILKFIVPLHQNAAYIEVNHLSDDGVWQNIYGEKL